MTMHTRRFKEEIQELADERLTPAARVEVEKHLALCEECRREFDALRWTKQLSSRQSVVESVPAKLEENILAALDLEDRRSSNTGVSWNWWPKQRAILAYVSLLLVGAALVLSYFILRGRLGKSPQLSSKPELRTKQESPSKPNGPTKPDLPNKPELTPEPELSSKTELPTKPKLPAKTKPPKLNRFLRPDMPSEVARDYKNYKTDKLPLMLKTEDVKEMEKFFSEEGIPFKTRVFDLGMMNYRLLGGRAHKLITRKSAFFVYRGKGDDILVCQMYPGRVTELPAGAVLRENKGIQFYVYRVKDLTIAFWQEGAVICVLTSDMNPEQLVQLAFAKAVKV